jgi:hypothetical protein
MENFTEFVHLPIEVQSTGLHSYKQFIMNFFIVIGICSTAASFSIIVISHTLFNNISKAYRDAHGYDSDSEEEEEGEEGDDCPFEDKYLEAYKNLGDRDVDDSELISYKDNYDTEETPRGIVKLAYDKENKTFIYYSNSKDLPYNYLESIARGYVVQRDCKKILVDSKIELAKATEICKQQEEEEAERKLSQVEINKLASSSVFASFKKYTKESLIKKEVKKVPLMQETNRYVYRGTLLDFQEFSSTINTIPEDFEQLDYGTFKKLSADNEKKTL